MRGHAISTHLLPAGLLLALLVAAPAPGAIGAIDNVPAATLLLPYFEVDLSDTPNGPVTVFTIGNVDSAPALAHVTLWTDMGVPTYVFDVALAGHSLVEIDLRLVFDGIIPQTSSAATNCAALLGQGRLAPATAAGLRNAHTGKASTLLAGGVCGGKDWPGEDSVARGYVTVDSVSRCSTAFPGAPAGGGNPAYFVAGGAGIADNRNVLWGEYWVNDRAAGSAYGDALVALEAGAADEDTDGAGDYTFYGCLIGGSGADNREGLATSWFARYANGGTLAGATASLVWRDPGVVAPFPCASPPPGLSATEVLPFDEQEQVTQLSTPAFSLFPLAAEKVDLADPARVALPYASGFLALNLNLLDWRPPFSLANQAYVTQVFTTTGGRAAALSAWPLDNVAAPRNVRLEWLPACSDHVDNDGDGLVDYPADPGCPRASFESERPVCGDGEDNDLDGLTDLEDPGCKDAFWATENPECSNGMNDDWWMDSLTDAEDPECSGTPWWTSEYSRSLAECIDGIDNDDDGDIDFPADATCASHSGNETPRACGDGIDNDDDGKTDWPADPGCSDSMDSDETDPQCVDGADNDGDGKIDWPADPGCWGSWDTSETDPACMDGTDNDGDGKIDYPADPGCWGPTDTSEANPACSNGLDDDGDGFIDFPADPGCWSPASSGEWNSWQCSDGFDNDTDYFVDFPADPNCVSPSDNSEAATECGDSLDNDTDGAADFPDDAGCRSSEGLTERPECSDGTDNDGDGPIDAADPVCAFPWYSSEVFFPAQCSDGVDNDGDTHIDWPADPQCFGPDHVAEGAPQCSDGLDNDDDGRIDYPLDDGCGDAQDIFEGPDCANKLDDDMDGVPDYPSDPGCASATDNNEQPGLTLRQCSDGVDNDGDGLIDYPNDPGCISRYDNNEFHPV